MELVPGWSDYSVSERLFSHFAGTTSLLMKHLSPGYISSMLTLGALIAYGYIYICHDISPDIRCCCVQLSPYSYGNPGNPLTLEVNHLDQTWTYSEHPPLRMTGCSCRSVPGPVCRLATCGGLPIDKFMPLMLGYGYVPARSLSYSVGEVRRSARVSIASHAQQFTP